VLGKVSNSANWLSNHLAEGARYEHCLGWQGNEWSIADSVPDSWASVRVQFRMFPSRPAARLWYRNNVWQCWQFDHL
jgi:hypothetical protein